MARALITGSRGFTGRYLSAELSQAGWDVWGTGLDADPGNSRYLQLDICDPDHCRRVLEKVRPDAVVHLAALSFVGDDPDAIYQTNLLGTRTLLSALADSSPIPDSVILASSANVYGNQTSGMLSESCPPNPANDYAVSKLSMEYAARLWLPELPITITRPFNYTGAGQSERFLIPKIVAHYKRRVDHIELGNLNVARDFSDVRSIVTAYRRLLEVQPVGQTVNLCSGTSHSLEAVLALASEVSGHHLDVRVNPDYVRSNEVSDLSGNPAHLQKLIGDWEPIPLRSTIEWMLGTGVGAQPR